MMKRLCMCMSFVCVIYGADPDDTVSCIFRCIDQNKIKSAEALLQRDIARIAARQRMVALCATAASLGISSVLLYQWFFAKQAILQPSQSSAQSTPEHGDSPSSTAHVMVSPEQAGRTMRFARWMGSWMLGNAKNFLSYIPTGIALGLSNTLVARLTAAYERAQRPVLNWEWVVNEYTHVRDQLESFKYSAAALDGYSPVLEPCNHLTIQANAEAQVVATQSGQEVMPFYAVQELLRLKIIALKSEHDLANGQTLDVGCIHLSKQWEGVVQAVEYCLAYCAHCKKHVHMQEPSLEYNQLMMFEEELVQRTNMLAQQLTATVGNVSRALRAHTTTGLLAMTCEYSNWVQHYCAILGYNELLRV